jgi:3'-phosphoadenosine 5'-phosphosulfate sulfotransferase (PAPS reductase)/FAD synthetase
MNIARDENGWAHIVALSGGKDSTALALRLVEIEPRPYTYICTPTGDELPEMFEHWRKLSKSLPSPLIPLMTGSLKACIASNGMLPNFHARFCTRQLKIEPFRRFMFANMPIVAYVGLRADEMEREGTDYGTEAELFGMPQIVQRFPLREWGWGVKRVLGYLDAKGICIPERTDCARCFFQKLGEWHNLWLNHREIFLDAEQDEEKYGHTYRSEQRDAWPASLKDLRIEFEQGRIPTRSLRMMESRKGMCRTCSL